jgi:hypothetical protein
MAAPLASALGLGLHRDGDTLMWWAERAVRDDRSAAGRGVLRFVFYGRVSTED